MKRNWTEIAVSCHGKPKELKFSASGREWRNGQENGNCGILAGMQQGLLRIRCSFPRFPTI